MSIEIISIFQSTKNFSILLHFDIHQLGSLKRRQLLHIVDVYKESEATNERAKKAQASIVRSQLHSTEQILEPTQRQSFLPIAVFCSRRQEADLFIHPLLGMIVWHSPSSHGDQSDAHLNHDSIDDDNARRPRILLTRRHFTGI